MFSLSDFALAQRSTISGYVEDERTGESLFGVNIVDLNSQRGTTSNLYGFYSLSLPGDSVEVRFSYVGYEPQFHNFSLEKDTTIQVRLAHRTNMDEITIEADRVAPIEERSQMSQIRVPVQMIKSQPALLGESDVIKTLQMLPGVQSGSEGSSGLYVRGGGPDQNLILLDGVPVYNASHLFGFFSVFNSDAISNVSLTKGGFPARFGGRSSSVLEINMKEGNNQEFRGEGGLGLVASRLTLEGPIGGDRTSFMISGRRTYIDLLMAPVISNQSDGDESFGYYFWDMNAKVNHRFSERSRLYFSIYGGDDHFYYKDEYDYGNVTDTNDGDLSWGNITSALRWNYQFSNRLFSNITLIHSRYQFNIGSETSTTERGGGQQFTDSFSIGYRSGIRDWGARIDFDYFPDPDHYIRFGGMATTHRFSPGALQFRDEDQGETDITDILEPNEQNGLEYFLYAEDDYKVTDWLKLNFGLHHSGFYTDNTYYPSLQPRVSSVWDFYGGVAVKLSYAYMAQHLHLLTNTGIGLPTDLWVPVTNNVKPQRSHQIAGGLARSFMNGQYEISLEVYYKKMDGLIEYKEGAQFIGASDNWDEKVETGGVGWSRGIEFFLERSFGSTTGWIGYTLSRTDRQFKNLNSGDRYPYNYDRRHDLSLVVSHKLSDRIDIGGNWVYGTGNATTLPLATFRPNDTGPQHFRSYGSLQYYGDRNSYRMRAYHRFDIGIQFHRTRRWGERTLSLDIYNVYNRKNPFFMYLHKDQDSQETVGRQVSLFPILPSISYNFKF